MQNKNSRIGIDRVTATLEEKQGRAILRLVKANHGSIASAVRTTIDAGLKVLDPDYAMD